MSLDRHTYRGATNLLLIFKRLRGRIGISIVREHVRSGCLLALVRRSLSKGFALS